ncbi:MAG: translocation/assembly module TamB domain-containing protein [Sulfurimonas sp.]|nr:translocation/assembly module TamB domain-containing protein [Sulfurimonas sp.]
MIRDIYLPLRMLLLIVLLSLMGVVVLFTHKDVVPFLAEKYLHDFDIQYSKAEGTLLHGVTLYDVKYKDAISAKSLQIEYNILNLLRPTPSIEHLRAQSLFVYVDKLPQSEPNATAFTLPAFTLENLLANDTKIIFSSDTIGFDIKASELLYDETLSVKKVALAFRSSYANAVIQGEIRANILYGDANAEIDKKIITETLAFIKAVPKKVKLKLEAGLDGIKAASRFEKLQLASDEAFVVQNADVDFAYIWGAKDFNTQVKYDLLYTDIALKAEQKIDFDIKGKYDSSLRFSLLKEPYGLPFKTINATMSGDTKKIEAKLNAQEYSAILRSSDYINFDIQANAKELNLSTFWEIPEVLSQEKVSVDARVKLQSSPLDINAEIAAHSAFGDLDAKVEYTPNKALYEAAFIPNAAHELYKNINIEQFSPLHAKYRVTQQKERLEVDANMLQMKLSKKNEDMYGSGNIGSTKFDIVADLDEKKIHLSSKVASLKKLIANLFRNSLNAEDFYDANIELKATINYDENLSVESKITMPLYVIKVDTQTSHVVENISFQSSYKNNLLIINEYFFRYKAHDFYSKRASTIHFDADLNILLDELWLYDNVLIKGFINKESMEGNVTLTSESFSYKGDDADLKAHINLRANFSPKVQKVEGRITLLEGVIMYKPLNDYAIDDQDIIIIQDIKEEKNSHLYINIQVDAAKPIAYKIKDVNLMVTPDLTIFEEPNTAFGLLGMLTINSGDASFSDKKFEFDKSEIYFNGKKPINPQLNLNLHYYTLDYKDIEIYVTNTMEDPVIIFSSKPAMSQNDIMSYILFGDSSSAMFDPSSESSSSSLLLASGLKQLVNETSFVQVDTLNILTNKEGTLGYEIGSRFNEKIRIVYKNDTASSLTIQYSLSKSIRVDIDVRETGQGVSVIYIKDL